MEISAQDIGTIGLLVFLEGILSIDNALALAVIARRLPQKLQRKALTYGLVGAVVFRIGALFIAGKLMEWTWVKFVGGGYLIYVAASHWLSKKAGDESENATTKPVGFWKTIVLIELTDIAFAADSILAAVALTPKLWLVVTGGIIGLIMMRFAASIFIKLLDRFPHFETSAYLMVLCIGIKLTIDGFKLSGVDFHSSSSAAFWIFWGSVVASIGVGFLPKKKVHA